MTEPINAVSDEITCVTRRHFLLSGSSTVLLTALPGVSSQVFASVKNYPETKVASLGDLRQDEQVYFRYPVTESIQCNNFLVKLGERAGAGVGPRQDIVAFSSYCPHMGGPLNGVYNSEHKVAGPCPLHLTTFDLTRHGMVISGHATESLPQILLDIRGNDIYAVGVMGLLYGHHQNVELQLMRFK